MDDVERFDRAYFDRFYEQRATRVHGKRQVAHLARGVTEMIAWFGGDLRSVLDVGAGTGLWRDWFARNKKGVHYVSTDVSSHACERYGHLRRDIAKWRGRERFDLVVCQGVLPYLNDEDVAKAIENIAAMCRGFLYLEAITSRDLDEICDRDITDTKVHRRSAAWYERHLRRSFRPLGCGLHYVVDGPLGFYDLEAPKR